MQPPQPAEAPFAWQHFAPPSARSSVARKVSSMYRVGDVSTWYYDIGIREWQLQGQRICLWPKIVIVCAEVEIGIFPRGEPSLKLLSFWAPELANFTFNGRDCDASHLLQIEWKRRCRQDWILTSWLMMVRSGQSQTPLVLLEETRQACHLPCSSFSRRTVMDPRKITFVLGA